MDAIKFAEWIAENHFYLYNKSLSDGVYYWRNEVDTKTTQELYKQWQDQKKVEA